MTFLPIVARELRVASRRSSTYWSRAQVVVAALIPTAFLLIGPTMAPFNLGITTIGTGFLWLAAMLTLLTGYDYLKAALRHAVDW